MSIRKIECLNKSVAKQENIELDMTDLLEVDGASTLFRWIGCDTCLIMCNRN